MAFDRSESPSPAQAVAVRRFGRLQLRRLLGKSERSMAWEAFDPESRRPQLLVLPRVQPAPGAAQQAWLQRAQRVSRLAHPNLAPVCELGVQDGWPFVTHELNDWPTQAERGCGPGLPGAEVAALGAQLLQGLAYVHEAGLAHHDLQGYLLLVADNGALRLAGTAVAEAPVPVDPAHPEAGGGEAASRREQRAAAELDVLAAGVLLHGLITGQGALEEADVGRVVRRLPPLGRETLRLPWSLAQPLAEPLRAIVNRATDRQERQRYRNARTLLRALEGWLQAESDAGGGPLALLDERLRIAGVLPSSPGAGVRSARLAKMERERTNELAEVVLQDMALSFELLRLVNSASVRGTQIAGSGPVLTVRRAIAMLGLDGVRHAASALRPWPGPLNEAGALQLERLMDRCRHAGRVAMLLRPAGYDGEVVYLLTLLQNLGRLVLQYHFAEEAQQIQRLMLPAPPAREGEPEQPGMSEEGAAFAVLGTDIESIGAAVARHWGLGDKVLHMIRRLPRATPVRSADSDDDLLRTVASCANEAVDAQGLPAAKVHSALHRVVQHYGRVLGIGQRELQAALAGQSTEPIAQTAPAPLDLLAEAFGPAAGRGVWP